MASLAKNRFDKNIIKNIFLLNYLASWDHLVEWSFGDPLSELHPTTPVVISIERYFNREAEKKARIKIRQKN